jgi:hypothetical protein
LVKPTLDLIQRQNTSNIINMTNFAKNEITWRQLTGNKFNRSLHPAMLSENGSIELMLIQPRNLPKGEYRVLYNKSYVIGFIASKFVKPLQLEGYDGLCEIVAKSWEEVTGRNITSNIDPDELKAVGDGSIQAAFEAIKAHKNNAQV